MLTYTGTEKYSYTSSGVMAEFLHADAPDDVQLLPNMFLFKC